jgi:hypothetical protein
MFRFSMDIRDASIYTDSGLRKYGLMEDAMFLREKWIDFFKKHPNYDPENPASEGYDEALKLSQEIVFRMRIRSPKTVEDARNLVQNTFFFSPQRVWLGDQEYRITEMQQAS